MITVFTPTYNRKKEIHNLYESLKKQTNQDFEWLIVDDGSTDGTEDYIKSLEKEKKLKINYIKQKNKGKHSAFNNGIKNAKGEIFICVDSDDTLLKNALEEIIFYYNKYKDKNNIAGFVFLKGYNEKNAVTNRYEHEEIIENYNSYIINKGFKGDKAEVFVTKILKKYEFPVFENEKFLAEGFLWSKIGRNYNYVFINKIIYICDYLPTGLTKLGRKMRIKCPYGGMQHAKEYLDNVYNIKVREKNALLFLIYGFFSKQNIFSLIKNNKKNGILLFLNIIPSFILYKIWEIKYGK